jgi:ribose/xylose/arabinose/galactoside ABC-type transport system permease subunit
MTTERDAPVAEKLPRRLQFDRGSIVQRSATTFVFMVVVIFFSIGAPSFLTGANIFDVARQVALVGPLAVGETFVILTAGIDLSVAQLAVLCGMFAAEMQVGNHGLLLSIAVPLLVGAGLGLLQGSIVTLMGVPPFVVTLGGFEAFHGLALLVNNGLYISMPNGGSFGDNFSALANEQIGPFPTPLLIFLGLVAISYVVLRNSRFGRHLYAVGGNAVAARLSGLRVRTVTTAAYIISGACAGLTGVLVTARLGVGDPTTLSGGELIAIASVVIGGTSLFGGRGGVIGTLLGAALLGVITNGLLLMQVSANIQPVVIGCLIVFAVLIDQFIKRRR